MSATTVAVLTLRVLDTALAVAELRAQDRERLDAQVEKLRSMIDEGRDPTPEEWDDANALSDSLLEELRLRVQEQSGAQPQ